MFNSKVEEKSLGKSRTVDEKVGLDLLTYVLCD